MQVEWPGIIKNALRLSIGTREDLRILINKVGFEKILIGFMGLIKVKEYHGDD